MIWVFECVVFLMLVASYKIYKKMITPFNLMAVPYAIIILLNNYWAVDIGFYPIIDQVILMILAGLSFVFCGTLLANNKRKLASLNYVKEKEKDVSEFQLYNMKGILYYVLFVDFISFLRFVFAYMKGGWLFFVSDVNEGYMMSGIGGHFLLSAFPLIPIVFYYWLKNKHEIVYFVSCILAFFLVALSFVKYHILSLFLYIYLFVAFKDRRYFRIGTIFVVVIVMLFFMGNYFITFLIRGSELNDTFYLMHFWKYVGGSLIHDTLIFTTGMNVEGESLIKLNNIIFTLPDYLLIPFVGERVFFTELDSKVYLESVGNMGEVGNVIDFIGYMFPSVGNLPDYIVFAFTFLLLGYISSCLYNMAIKDLNNYAKLTGTLIFLTFFCLLAFFSVYGLLSTTWELMVWSFTIPHLFYKRRKIKFRFI